MSYVGKVTDTAGNTHLVGSTLYGTCDTAISTATKEVVCPNFDKLETGVTIHVKFDSANDAASPKLKVGNTDAKPILGTTGVITGVSKWSAGAVVSFTYDGQYWCMNDVYFVNTDTKNTAGSTNSTSKLFLIGAGSQAANPQTYSHSHVWMENGGIIADSYNGIEISHPVSDGAWLKFQYGTGTPNVLQVPANKSYSLKDACAKGVDTSIASGSTSTNLPTTQAVADYVDSAVSTATSGALSYHGVATALTDITDTNYKKGWYWMVGTNPSITVDGVTCEAGDMIIAQQDKTATADNDLDVVQTNIEALTNAEIDALWAAA